MDIFGNSLQIELHEAGSRRIGRWWHTRDKSDSVSRLWFIESGHAWLHHHGQDVRLRAGWTYLLPAYTSMSFCCKKTFYAHWLHFNAALFGGPEVFDLVKCRYAFRVSEPDRILASWRRLETIADREEPALRLEAKGLALQLMAPFILATTTDGPSSPEVSIIREVVAYIDAHLHERITVSQVARAAHLERSYFSRTFKKHTGLRPSEYIRKRRIHQACEWLLREPITLSCLADRLGFADAFHLSRVFKRVVGVSPREFRHRPKLTP